jgi:hypothetical protein
MKAYKFQQIMHHLEKIMETQVTNTQALADLTAAVTSLQGSTSELTTADAALDAAITSLLAAQAAGGGVSPAAVEALVAQLNTASAALKPVVTDLNSQSVALTPAAPVTVLVAPATAGPVAQGSTQQFTATTNDAKGVVWTVAPATGGTVDPTGVYTPPTTPGGSATVTASSVTTPSVSASATVTY